MTKKRELAEVISQEKAARGIYSMWIRTESAKEAKPGQFISMYANDGSKLLPRPISICEIDREGGALRVVYRVTGKNTGTEEFSRLKAGDTLPIVGPLGNGFPYEKAEGKKRSLLAEESECRRSWNWRRRWSAKRSRSSSDTGTRRRF